MLIQPIFLGYPDLVSCKPVLVVGTVTSTSVPNVLIGVLR